MWLFAFSLDVSSPGVSTLLLESHHPEDFSSNPNQTHPNQLIKVFRATWSLQTGVLEQGWNWSLQDGGSPGAGLEIPALECLIIEIAYYQDSSG